MRRHVHAAAQAVAFDRGAIIACCRQMSVADYSAWFVGLPPDQQWPQMLRDVVAWLLLNSMLSERTQLGLGLG